MLLSSLILSSYKLAHTIADCFVPMKQPRMRPTNEVKKATTLVVALPDNQFPEIIFAPQSGRAIAARNAAEFIPSTKMGRHCYLSSNLDQRLFGDEAAAAAEEEEGGGEDSVVGSIEWLLCSDGGEKCAQWEEK